MSDNLIRDAFKHLDTLNEDTFDLDKEGISELEKFLDGDYVDSIETEYIIDPEAEDEEELQDSYDGKVILSCDVCHSMVYKDQDKVIIDDETERANVGEECPYCQSADGFKIIGVIAPYDEEEFEGEEEPKEDEEVEVNEDDLSLEEAFKSYRKSLKEYKIPTGKEVKKKKINLWDHILDQLGGTGIEYYYNDKGAKHMRFMKAPYDTSTDIGFGDNYIFVWVKDEEDASPAQKIADKYNLETKLGKVEPGVKDARNRKFFIYVDPEATIEDDRLNERLIVKSKKSLKEDKKIKNTRRNLKEGFQKISIENEENITTVDTDENGKTTVVTEPKQEEPQEDIGETIKPVPEEIKTEIEMNGEQEEEEIVEPIEDEIDVDVEEIDEEDFDNLGESYFKKVYDNVKSYKTISGRLNENKIMLEGLLTFKSGKVVKTNFIFESHYQTKTGKLKFLGENVQLSNSKKAFILTGRMEGTKLLTEALTYNYNAVDAKTGKKQKLYGTVKNPRRNIKK